MTEKELLKKKRKPKPSFGSTGRERPRNTFPTLGRIVSKNGSVVAEILELPLDFSELTTYDNMRCALEHAALAMCSLNRLLDRPTPTLTLTVTMDPIRLNLEDLMNHLYYAIQDFQKGTGSS